MFKLFKSLFEDKRYETLPKPTRPAPPMPECKPPLQEGISEPVITLLEELKQDVWEVSQDFKSSHTAYCITHIYKESVKFYLVERISYDITVIKNLYWVSWMTDQEKAKVIEALEPVIYCQLELQAQLAKINSREKFSKALLGK